MNKIFLAYDWIGPDRHYSNNQPFNINSPLSKLRTNSRSFDYFTRIGGFELKSTLLLKEHDLFIYEIDMGFERTSWFSNPQCGLLSMCSIRPDTLFKIRERNGFILLNLAHESITNEKMILDLHFTLRRDNIPLNKVILYSGSPSLKEMYDKLCYLRGIENQTRMKICTTEFFEFNTSYLMNEYKSRELPKNLNFDNIEKTFICLNRNHRHHRINFLPMAAHAKFLNDCYYTMPKICPTQGTEWTVNVSKDYTDAYNIKPETIEQINSMLPLIVDSDDFSDPAIFANNWGDNQYLYDASLISIVMETNYSDDQIFNTEKIFKPISYKHPFIIVGPCRTLEYLKTLGYRTFSNFWDERYDTIENPVHRMIEISNLCARINDLSISEKQDIFYGTVENTEHNYNLLKSMYIDPNQRRTFFHELRDNWFWNDGSTFFK
jgi:hypothetical protein